MRGAKGKTHCVNGHEFSITGRDKQGLCKPCKLAWNLRWQAKNKEKIARYHRRYYLKTAFNLTPEQVLAMFDSQGGKCAICAGESPLRQGRRSLHVDHDHKTGAVRQLLCQLCNQAIGTMRDSPELLRKAADYVEFHKNK